MKSQNSDYLAQAEELINRIHTAQMTLATRNAEMEREASRLADMDGFPKFHGDVDTAARSLELLVCQCRGVEGDISSTTKHLHMLRNVLEKLEENE